MTLALFLLAPWTAECAWGGYPVTQYPVVVLFLAPMYGGAAVLIRETARRTGGGWPAIVLLATAFGLVQAGLVDQSLFNPDFLAGTEFADYGEDARATLVPGLGLTVQQALGYVGGHVALTICAPIALVESLVRPERRRAPWLRRRGLAGIAALYLLGSLVVFGDIHDDQRFLLGPGQLTFTVGAALVLIVIAVRLDRTRSTNPGPVPRPLAVGALGAAAHAVVNLAPGRIGTAVGIAVVAGVAALVVTWSRRVGWTEDHARAGWSGPLLAAAAAAYLAPTYEPTPARLAVASDVVSSLIVLILVFGLPWFIRYLHR